MNPPPQRTGTNRRRKPPPKRPGAVDIWRVPAELPASEPIAVPQDVGALLRSLGDPPMRDGTTVAK
jgi:hypothetical protein